MVVNYSLVVAAIRHHGGEKAKLQTKTRTLKSIDILALFSFLLYQKRDARSPERSFVVPAAHRHRRS
jgi:hypothetical protein